jgi:hypothetical protein
MESFVARPCGATDQSDEMGSPRTTGSNSVAIVIANEDINPGDERGPRQPAQSYSTQIEIPSFVQYQYQ